MWNPVAQGRRERDAPAAAGVERRRSGQTVTRPAGPTPPVSSRGPADTAPDRSSRATHASPAGRQTPHPSVPRSGPVTNADPACRAPPGAAAGPSPTSPAAAGAPTDTPPDAPTWPHTPTDTAHPNHPGTRPGAPADSSDHADTNDAD